MRYLITSVFILSFSLCFHKNVFSQISQGGVPQSFIYGLPEDYELIEYNSPDLSKISIEDDIDAKNGEIYRIGVSVPINAGIENAGSWHEIPGKGRIWRFMIKAENAKALGVYFDKFKLPSGGELFLYSYDKKQIIGAFTEINNDASGLFATELIEGDVVTLEYFEPISEKGKAIINISEVAYIYRGVSSMFEKDYGDADYCLININCAEGANWQNQKRGVARILLKKGNSYGWCSGSLVNNVRQDCTPYFLTADHCGTGASTTDFNQWVFYFNYESSGCPSAQPSSNQTITGSTVRARGGSGGSTGSDFLLLQLNSAVPASYNVYYNGWSNINTAPSSGVSIHHPMGDIKKISTFTSTPSTTGWNGSSYPSHWQITWATTTNGRSVTEGGSSGSPLFNNNGLIIGDLTGGGSYCGTPYNTYPDYYGKFSYSWSSNGTTAATRLKNWLDMDNTGATTLQGKFCSTTPPPQPGACDTVSNLLSTDQMVMTKYQQQWGSWAGHSGYLDNKFADYHSGTTQNTKIQGLYLAVGKAYSASTSSKISIKVWGAGSVPGTELGSKDVLISSFNPGYWNYVPFNSPVTVGTNFYVGFQVYYNTAVDTFAIYHAAHRPSGSNTAFAFEDGAWHAWSSWSMNSSLGIYAVVCPLTTEASEEMENAQASENNIIIFPNPSTGNIFINTTQEFESDFTISVYNSLGISVYNASYKKGNLGITSIDMTSHPQGMYFLKFNSPTKEIIRKISIIR